MIDGSQILQRIYIAILYKLKYDQAITTIPTVGFNSESLLVKNVKFNVWVSSIDITLNTLNFPSYLVGRWWSEQAKATMEALLYGDTSAHICCRQYRS